MEVELAQNATVMDLLKVLGVQRETVVVFLNGRVVPEEAELHDGAEVAILPVVTGG